ncbi:MAG: serine/threonine-protein phosphatase [Acidimicrobiaceae bacterium]|nr:serine/threonine-protein phosphatase [Acidimicrobiaceae bacterium]
MTQWRFAAATDTGLVRDTNQDAIYVDETLAIVADGMGGHAAGEVASALTVDVVLSTYRQRPTIEGLLRALEDANVEVLRDASVHPDRAGMGTTALVVGLTRDPSGVTVPTMLHVGDSRAYQIRDGALRQLSSDHSVAEEWVRMGRLTPDEALVHPRRHQLTRAIGVDDDLQVDVLSLHVQPGDRILLCSDGLSNELSDDRLADLAGAPVPLDEAVTRLVDAAKHAGGRDNISVVLVEFTETDEPSHHWDTTMSRTPDAAPTTGETSTPVVSRRPRRRVTFRSVMAVLVLLAVGAGVVGVVSWYAYSSYYLGARAGHVVVFQGQPGGVLWFKPRVVDTTPYLVKNLRLADQQNLAQTIAEPSRAAALSYATYLYHQWSGTHSVTPTTSTTLATGSTSSTSSTSTTTKTGG